MPVLAAWSAWSCFFSPRERESRAFMPTAVPPRLFAGPALLPGPDGHPLHCGLWHGLRPHLPGALRRHFQPVPVSVKEIRILFMPKVMMDPMDCMMMEGRPTR